MLVYSFVRVYNTEGPLLPAQRVEPDEEKDDQQLKQASDRATVLQDELIQAADRERQLQIQLDKMKDDLTQLQMQLKPLSSVQKDFDNLKRRSAPLWEREMNQRDSRFNMDYVVCAYTIASLTVRLTDE